MERGERRCSSAAGRRPPGPGRPGPQSRGLSESGWARPPLAPPPPPHLGPRQRRGRHGPAQEGGGEQHELDALRPGQRHGALATGERGRGSQPPEPRLIRRDTRAPTLHFRARGLFKAGDTPLRAAGTASSPPAPSGGPAGRCGRSWAASARSATPGWARTARGRRSGRGARGTAARPAARR